MRHYLLAIALAAASLALSVPGHAGTTHGEGDGRQTCITKRLNMKDNSGKSAIRRVRVCQ